MSYDFVPYRLSLIISSIALTQFGICAESSLRFEGSDYKVIEVAPARQSGLDAVYVLNSIKGVTIEYESENNVEWSVFDNAGAAYAIPFEHIKKQGNRYILENPEPNLGYILKDGSTTRYFWIVDYSGIRLKINSISGAAENDCISTILNIDGYGPDIAYYGINGKREVISRDIIIEYNSLEWDAENKIYNEYNVIKNLPSLSAKIILTPPAYCETKFYISGDRFLDAWGMPADAESEVIKPSAVEVMTEATQQLNSDNDFSGGNQIGFDSSELGGSAPCIIDFKSHSTDAVIHHEWQISEDENFDNILYRLNQQDINFTFSEEGQFFVRFIGSNSDGSCEAYGETYRVAIGASELKIPNAFSPDNDGINDIWKVSYRSLLDFKCSIFDRQGHEIYHFTDPAGGWDGKKNGKLVKPGVYFYVIEATGADGKQYKKGGDINILRYKTHNSSADSSY